MSLLSHPSATLPVFNPLRYLPVCTVPPVDLEDRKGQGMLLSDTGLESVLTAEPGNPYRLGISDLAMGGLQPASIDVRLGYQVKRAVRTGIPLRLGPDGPPMADMSHPADGAFCIRPGEFYLGTTLERFEFGPGLAGKLEGKSSVGRYGISIHSTAGWIDPGFEGEITFEIKNDWPDPIMLEPGMKIAQICVFVMQDPAARPYGHPSLDSKYQNQRGPTESRYRHG